MYSLIDEGFNLIQKEKYKELFLCPSTSLVEYKEYLNFSTSIFPS